MSINKLMVLKSDTKITNHAPQTTSPVSARNAAAPPVLRQTTISWTMAGV